MGEASDLASPATNSACDWHIAYALAPTDLDKDFASPIMPSNVCNWWDGLFMFSRIVIWLGMADETAFFNKLGVSAEPRSAFGERPNCGELASRGHSHSRLAIAR